MLNRILEWLVWHLLVACVIFAFVITIGAQNRSARKHKTRRAQPSAEKTASSTATVAEAEIIGKQIKFADGSTIEADEVWKQGEDLWYRTGGMTRRVARDVRSIEPIRAEAEKQPPKTVEASTPSGNSKPPAVDAFWILLKGGARMKVDDVAELDDGTWYRRGNVSMFIERDRIDRIERESALAAAEKSGWKQRDWTSGNAKIDELIRTNGARFGVDPYLVFCVIEHESHFHTRAVSPKGARGLMQLMPGTASRLGVRKPFDPAQNIFGGTQYLKGLLQMFGGRLDLALASYNAGEGAVIKYGRTVPPYRETRDYVRRVTRRYGGDGSNNPEKTSPLPR